MVWDRYTATGQRNVPYAMLLEGGTPIWQGGLRALSLSLEMRDAGSYGIVYWMARSGIRPLCYFDGPTVLGASLTWAIGDSRANGEAIERALCSLKR